MLMSTQILKSFALAAIALSAIPAAAHAGTESETRSFNRNGVDYAYTSVVEGKQEVLRGTANGVPFRFVVRGDYVSGYNGFHAVEFTYRPAKKPARTAIAAAR